MKRFDPRIVFGLLLIVGGLLALAQSMGFLENASNVFWGGIFIALGLGFLFLLAGGNWWGVFPGSTLLAIGILIVLPQSVDALGGAVFLEMIALSFWVAYLSAPGARWWALIPAGVITTLAGVTIASERVGGNQTAGLFFLGLAITFLLVALLAGMPWAYWPALVLGIMGLLGLASMLEAANYLYAILLIGGGTYLLIRYFSGR
jgi:hypothetical protein